MHGNITLDIPGNPIPQKRARHSRAGFTYTDSEQRRNNENTAGKLLVLWGSSLPIEGPIALGFVFILTRPKGHYGKRGLKITAPTYHTSRPDLDNLIKHVKDCAKGILWRDDSQVCQYFRAQKIYGGTPRTILTVRMLGGQAALDSETISLFGG